MRHFGQANKLVGSLPENKKFLEKFLSGNISSDVLDQTKKHLLEQGLEFNGPVAGKGNQGPNVVVKIYKREGRAGGAYRQ